MAREEVTGRWTATPGQSPVSVELEKEMQSKAAKIRDQQPGLTREEAFAKLLEEEPELYTQYIHTRDLEEYLAKP